MIRGEPEELLDRVMERQHCGRRQRLGLTRLGNALIKKESNER
ncbi:hypothetical protein ACRJ4B_01765 [Streptomyces sp. GTA36]